MATKVHGVSRKLQREHRVMRMEKASSPIPDMQVLLNQGSQLKGFDLRLFDQISGKRVVNLPDDPLEETEDKV